MDNQSDLIQAIEESQKAFEEQFDVNSVNHHKGLTTVVPLGGERIPDSMKTVYPENVQNIQEYIQQSEQTIDYGEEYNLTVLQRQGFLDLKKNLTTMTKILESMVRHKEVYLSSEQQNVEKSDSHQKTFKKNIEADGKKLKEIQEILISQIQIIEGSEYKERYEGIRQMLIEAESFNDNNKNKQQLGEYFLNMKKFSQNAFSDSQKHLDKLKKIKKNRSSNQTQQQQQQAPQQQEQQQQLTQNSQDEERKQ